MGRADRKAARAERAARDAAVREAARFRESFTGVRYLGGWPDFEWRLTYINLVFEPGEIRFGDTRHAVIVPVADLTDLVIEGPESADRKTSTGAVVAFGVLGLGVSSDQNSTFLRIVSGDRAADFMFDRTSAGALRARLARWSPNSPGPSPQFSVADELEKLASLRDRGILSDDEFAIQKARLLA